MDSSNLWNRRSNTTKLSLSTSNSEQQGPRGFNSAKRWGPNSAQARTTNPVEDKSPAATTPGTGASSAFGLGSGAFASFTATNKSRTSLGAASDSTASPAREKGEKESTATSGKTPKAQTSISSLSNSVTSLAAEHPTRYSWIIWYRPPTSKYNDYEKSIAPVAAFSTVEAFWTIYAHLKNPSTLPTVSDYHIFKKGIRPVWEDDENRKGGKWIMRLRKGVCDRYWEDLLLGLVGDQFAEAGEEVCGVVLSVKAGEDVLSVWTRIDGGRNIKIRETIKRLLSLPSDTNIVWKSHDASIAQRSEMDKAHQDKVKGNMSQSMPEKNGVASKKS